MQVETPADAAALGRNLSARIGARAAEADARGSLPDEDVLDLVAAGYPGLSAPRDLGGRGASLAACVAANLELAKGSPSTALVAAMTVHLVGYQREVRTWPSDIFERLSSAAAEGQLLNSAASEPKLGSPSRGGLPQTRAVPRGDQVVVSGHKTWVTGGRHLSHLLVRATMDDERVDIWVPAHTGGVRWETTWGDSLALRASDSNDLFLEGVAVPTDHLLSGEAAQNPVPNIWFPLLTAATYLGPALAARDEAVRYALERTPTALGKPIATLPKIQRQVGEIDVALMAARTVLLDTAGRWDGDPEQATAFLPLAAAAKHLAVETALEVTDKALRLVGAAAMGRQLPLERHFRDVRAGLMHPPSGDAALEMVGRGAVGL